MLTLELSSYLFEIPCTLLIQDGWLIQKNNNIPALHINMPYWVLFNEILFNWSRVEEDENIADLSPYDKYKQISSHIWL